MTRNKDMSRQITHQLKMDKFMTDVIYVQVILSRLHASSYDFKNKEKYNMNLRFIEV